MPTDNDRFEAEVCSAVEQGHNVQEMVRQLTLRRISARALDIESLRQIAASVLRGARSAVQKESNLSTAQIETTRILLKQAVAGLDGALAQLTAASRLAIEEAASRAQQFSREDLTRTRADLEDLEEIFLETLQTSATSARDLAGDMLHDLAAHYRTQGSAIGSQVKAFLSVVSHQLTAATRTQAATGLHLAQATGDLLRQIAAGVLHGVADHIKPDTALAAKLAIPQAKE